MQALHSRGSDRILDPSLKLADLHVHLGSAAALDVMWEIGNRQGINMQAREYWEFVRNVTSKPEHGESFEQYLKHFDLTERIQSSPMAVETCVYQAVGGAYRNNNVTLLELRFNPMKRNRGKELDLDRIIRASLQGMELAMLDYPVKGGIIVMLDRTFPYELNEILVHKAVNYSQKGVVGIDIGGPHSENFEYSHYKGLYELAREHGLGLTVHAGEDEDFRSVIEVVQSLRPDRIGHGVTAAWSPEAMDLLAERGITLEVCPTSNLNTHVVNDVSEMGAILSEFKRHGVKFTINTDGPVMLQTSVRNELQMLLREGILDDEEARQAVEQAFRATFIR